MQLTSIDGLIEYFEAKGGADLVRDQLETPCYNVAPSLPLVAVCWRESQRAWTLFKWGFVPPGRMTCPLEAE